MARELGRGSMKGLRKPRISPILLLDQAPPPQEPQTISTNTILPQAPPSSCPVGTLDMSSFLLISRHSGLCPRESKNPHLPPGSLPGLEGLSTLTWI